MLKFNSLRKLKEGVGSPAGDYTKSLTQDDDEEATTYKPRSKGEEDFAAKHTKVKKAHPVAPEDQFKGGTKHSGDHKGYEGAPGEKNVVKAKKTFAQLRGGGSSKRKADKTQGDMAMKKVKEEFELNEAMVAEDPMLMRTLTKMASSRTPMPMKLCQDETKCSCYWIRNHWKYLHFSSPTKRFPSHQCLSKTNLSP